MNPTVQITAATRGTKSYLKNGYAATPFKLANITENLSDNTLRLMLMSSSPGVLDNDAYHFNIQIEENAALHLTTQGYQRLFTMKTGASQHIEVILGSNASLCYLPHPTVPHKQSSFTTINNICLGQVHRLLWSEIITCGRKLSGEIFTFSKYQSMTSIYINEKLVVRENILLQPQITLVHSIGQLEGYTHQLGLLFLQNEVNVVGLIDSCRQVLQQHKKVAFGVSALPVNGLLVRMLGFSGEQLYDCSKVLAGMLMG